MQFHEKIAFAAVTTVFVAVCLGVTAAGLGVDFRAQSAVEWLGAIGSGVGGIGAAIAAAIALYSTRRSEAAALAAAGGEVVREARALADLIEDRRVRLANAIKDHMVRTGDHIDALFEAMNHDEQAYIQVGSQVGVVLRSGRFARDMQEVARMDGLLVHVRTQVSIIDEVVQNRLDRAYREGKLSERVNIRARVI